MSSRAYKVVSMFEDAVAERLGASHGVAVESCTFALMLSCLRREVKGCKVWIPGRTYISVAQAIMHAGGMVQFDEREWVGSYNLRPYNIWDSAKCFDKGSYQGGLHCVSFHIKKACPIGRGGMILTDDADDAEWARKMRYEGREGLPYDQERVSLLGWNAYLTPDAAARGLMILDTLPDTIPPDGEVYSDLRLHPLFADTAHAQA